MYNKKDNTCKNWEVFQIMEKLLALHPIYKIHCEFLLEEKITRKDYYAIANIR